ncbi:MAG: LuxR C-terminal-related transcriptional regulator [Planctomycetota bacterium]
MGGETAGYKTSRATRPVTRADLGLLDVVPGIFAVARDESFRQFWCNQAYAKAHDTEPEQMAGMTLRDVLPEELAEERESHMLRALEGGEALTYDQMWRGGRYTTQCFPLDRDDLGARGWLVVLKLARPETEGPDGVVHSGDLGDLSPLSRRELEVFRLLGFGLTTPGIAERLHRSPRTVEKHLDSIKRKLEIRTTSGLVRLSVERGLPGFTDEDFALIAQISTRG